MPLPLTIYGATDCEDTWQVREWLNEWSIPFGEVNIDDDAEAERFVIFVNNGNRSTPTLVFGDGKRKTILTEPGEAELKIVLREAGYVV